MGAGRLTFNINVSPLLIYCLFSLLESDGPIPRDIQLNHGTHEASRLVLVDCPPFATNHPEPDYIYPVLGDIYLWMMHLSLTWLEFVLFLAYIL
jgi:hypothetical protein